MSENVSEQLTGEVTDSLRVATLERRVELLTLEIENLKSERSVNTTLQSPLLNESDLLEIVRITQEMFPGKVTVEVVSDPSEPDEEMIVFEVNSAESVNRIIELRREWHRRIAQSKPGRTELFGLSVTPT